MSRTSVSNYLISPGTERGKNPATQGSSWSCNMFREVNGQQNYLTSLPGLKFSRRIHGASRCRGAYVSSVGLLRDNQEENAFVVFGNALYRIDWTGEVTELGKVASGLTRVCFSETGGLRPMLLVADGVNLWTYDLLEGGDLVRITLPDRVTGEGGQIKPSHVIVIDGVIAVNDTTNSGMVYYSTPYPLNSENREVFKIVDGEVQYEPDNPLKVAKMSVPAVEWVFKDNYGVVQFRNADTSSDNIQALAAVGSTLYVLGKKTIEIWTRGSTELESWICTSYTTNASNGVAAPNSIAVCGSTLFYLGKGDSYAKAVMSVTGTNYSKVSDTWLDQLLLNETSETAYGFSYAQNGHIFYVLQLTASGQTWVYDVTTKEWHQRVSRQLDTGREIPWRVQAMMWFKSKFWAFCNDGCMYEHSTAYWWEDFGNSVQKLPMIRHRQGQVIVNENAPFVFLELAIECNVGTVDDYSEDARILLEVSKDGGNTWSNMRSAPFGKTGQYGHRVRFLSLGYNRLCVLRVTYSSPSSLELTSCSQRIAPTAQVI